MFICGPAGTKPKWIISEKISTHLDGLFVLHFTWQLQLMHRGNDAYGESMEDMVILTNLRRTGGSWLNSDGY